MAHRRARTCVGAPGALLAWRRGARGAAAPEPRESLEPGDEDHRVDVQPDRLLCPRDGESRCAGVACNGDLTGWIWATGAQVIALMGHYDPAILTADPPAVGGPEHLMQAISFVEAIGPTFFFSGYSSTDAWVSGWTATDLLVGGASYSYPWFSASLAFAQAADGSSPYRGAWLWRPSTDDLTPPVITPVVSGTAGSNGWYTSNVTVTWNVQDPESAATPCDDGTVTVDTTGTTFSCTSTSAGGTATASTVVKRDTVGRRHLRGQRVRARPDARDGHRRRHRRHVRPGEPDGPVAGQHQRCGHVQRDPHRHRPGRAAHHPDLQLPGDGAEVQRPYATIVGTGANNTINGTSGRDVIVALGGLDTIDGKGGDDVICGGDGPDTVSGGDGKDWIDGGAGNDDLNGGNGDDFLDGGLGSDSIRGDGGRDTCVSGEQRMSSCEA